MTRTVPVGYGRKFLDSARRNTAIMAAVAAVCAGYMAAPARANQVSWIDVGTDWGTGTNWAGSVAPGSTDDAVFNLATINNQPVVGSPQSVQGLIFGNNLTATAGVTLGGGANTLTLGLDGITMNALSGAVTISDALALGAGQTWTNNSASLLTISGNVANGANLLAITGSGNTSISGIIGNGAGGLTMSGSGTLTLTAADTYTGATLLSRGTVLLSGASGAITSSSGITLSNRAGLTLDETTNNTDRIGNAIPITSNGGVFTFSNPAAAGTNYSESIGAVTVGTGALDVLTSQAASGQTATLTISSMARSAGGTVLFSGTGLGASTANAVSITSAGTGWSLSNGIIPYAMMYDGTTYRYVGSTTGTLTAYTNYFTGAASTANWNSSTINARPGASIPVIAAAGAYSLNSLTLDSGINGLVTGGDQTITMGGATGFASIVQTGGTSYFDKQTGGNEYIVSMAANTEFVIDTIGTLTWRHGNSNNITFASSSTGNNVTKTGPGTLNLGDPAGTNDTAGWATNNLGGAFTINQGTVQLNNTVNADALGAGTLVLNSGTLDMRGAAAIAFNRNTTVNGDFTMTSEKYAAGAGVTYTFGTLTIGASALTVSGGANDNAGTPGVTFGAVTLSGNATFNIAKGAATGTATAPLLTVGAITNGANTLTLTGGGTFVQTGAIGNGAGGLTLASGFTGTATLSQANLYTGPTTIGGGTLTLSAAGSINNSSLITMAGGTTYNVSAVTGGYALAQNLTAAGAGTTTITGSVNAGSYTLNMQDGANIGTLSLSSGLTLSGATLKFDVSNSSNDVLSIAGTAAVSGTNIINVGALTSATSLTLGTTAYTLITAGGGLNSANFSLSASTLTVGGVTYSLSLSGNATHEYLGIGGPSVTWTGAAGPSGAAPWDPSTPNLWKATVGGAAELYADNSPVVFDDSGVNTTGIVIQGPGVAPLSVVFSNTSTPVTGKAYSFAGSGGAITGLANVSVSGGGQVMFLNANTYTGGTAISNGSTLIVGNTGALGIAGAAVSITGGGTLDLQTNPSVNAYNMTIIGSGTIVADAASPSSTMTQTLGTLSAGGTLFVSKGANVSTTGILAFSGATTLNSATTLNLGAGTQLTLAGVTNSTYTMTISGAGNFTQTGVIGNGSGGVTLDTGFTGTATLSQSNNYTGGTLIQNGTLALGSNNGLPATTVVTIGSTGNAGKLDLAGWSPTVGGLAAAGTASSQVIGNSSGTPSVLMFTNTTTPATFAGTIQDTLPGGSSTVGVTVSAGSSLTLSGTNTYSGSTSVSGTLAVASPGSLGSSSTVTVNVGGTLGGTGTINGPVVVNGNLKPAIAATPSTLTIANTLALNAGANLALTLGSSSDLVQVNGAATLTGAETITITGGSGFGLGLSPYKLINTTGGVSNGATFTFVGPVGYYYTVSTVGNALQLSLQDFTIYWRATTNSNWSLSSADANWGGGPTAVYGDGAKVIFDDSVGAGSRNVIVGGSGGGTVTPVSITVAGTGAYELGGSSGGLIAGTTGIVMNGSGKLTIDNGGINTYSGGVTINSGTVDIGGSQVGTALGLATSAVTINNAGILEVSAALASARPVNLGSANSTVAVDSGVTYTASGVWSGTGNLNANVSGTGTLVLSGTNNFTGQTVIEAGVVQVATLAAAGNAQPLGQNASPLIIGTTTPVGTTNATFAYSGATATSALPITIGSGGGVIAVTTAGNTLTLTGVISGGPLTARGPGTLSLNGANNYSGGTVITGGIVAVGGTLGSGLVSMSGGSTLAFGVSGSLGSLASTGPNTRLSVGTGLTVNVGTDSTNTSFAGTLSGAGNFVKVGSGVLILSGADNVTGLTTIQSGTVQAGSASGFASRTITFGGASSGGTLDLNGLNVTVAGLAVTSGATPSSQVIGNSFANQATLTFAGGTGTFGGVIEDTLSGGSPSATTALTVSSGNLTLSNANTYSGGTTVTAGTLTISNGTTGSATGSGTVTVYGTLAGNGTILSNGNGVAVATGGQLTPHVGTGTTGKLTLGSGTGVFDYVDLAGSNALNFNFGAPNAANPALSVGDKVMVNGDFEYDGTVTLNINALSGFGVGNYEVVGYTGSLYNYGHISYAGGPIYLNYAIDTTDWANEVVLVVTPKPNLVWNGSAGGGGTANWSLSATQDLNWVPDAAGDNPAGNYVDQFPVTFGDTDGLGHAVTNASITLIGTLNPAKMTFTNNTVAYTIIGGGGSLAGSGSLVMNGTGLLTINDTVGTPNTFTGGTTINSGTIAINSATALGSASGGLTINAGTLEVTQTIAADTRAITLGDPAAAISVDGGMSYTNSGIMTGTGSLNATGAGTLALSGANNFTGQTIIQSGTVSVSSVAAALAAQPLGVNANPVVIGTATAYGTTNATLAYSGPTATSNIPVTIGAGGGAIAVTSSGTVLTLSSAVSGGGTGGLTVQGSGTLALSTNNSYSGGTSVVSGGKLQVINTAALGSGTLNVASGGTFRFVNTTVGSTVPMPTGSAAYVVSSNYTTSGTGNASSIGTGTSFWQVGANGNGGPQPDFVYVDFGSNKSFSQVVIYWNSANVTPGTFAFYTAPAGTPASSLYTAGNPNVLNIGAGSPWTLDSAQYTAAANVAGNVTYGLNGVTGEYLALYVTARNPTDSYGMQIKQMTPYGYGPVAQSVNSLSGPVGASVVLDSNVATSVGGDSTSTTFAGVISGPGSLVKVGGGRLTLSSAGGNTYVGGTTVSAGALDITNSSGSGTGSGPVTVTSPGSLVGPGAINATSNAITLGGGVAPSYGNGSTATTVSMTTTAGVTLANGVNLNFNFGNSATNTSDSISVTGPLAFGLTGSGQGTVTFNQIGGSTYSAGGTYTLVTASGAITGFVPAYWTVGGTLPAGFVGSISTSGSSLVLTLDEALTWYGQAGTNAWNIADMNWKNTDTLVPGLYAAGSVVTLDDNAGASHSNVTVDAGGVSPTSVTFNNNAVPYTLSGGAITGTAYVTVGGGGSVALNSDNSYTGGTFVVNNSTLTLGSAGAAGAAGAAIGLSGGGKLDLAPASNASVNAYNVSVTGTATIASDRGSAGAGITHTLGTLSIGANQLNITAGGNVTGGGTAGVTFSGTTTLTGSATFNITNPTVGGGTTVLTLGAVNNGANTITVTGNGQLAQSAPIAAGTGGFTAGPGFTGTATLNQVNLYTGATTLNSGTVNINADTALGNGGPVVFGGGTLQAAAPVTLSASRAVSISSGATGIIDTNGNPVSVGAISGAASAGLTKVGANTLTLTTAASYAGTTVVSGGTLKLGATPGLALGGGGTIAPAVLGSAAINVDASALPSNSTTVTSVTNLGTAGGAFTNTTAYQSTNVAPTYSATAINGHPALIFDNPTNTNLLGTCLVMDPTTGTYTNTTGQISVFLVENQTRTVGIGYPTEMGFVGPNGNGDDYNVAGNMGIDDNGGGTAIRTVTSANVGGASINRPGLNQPIIWGTVIDTTANSSVSDLITAAAGTTFLNQVGGGAYTVPFNINTISIGGRINGGLCQGDWAGQYGQILVFNSALSASDRTAVETYLTAKWLSPLFLPIATPVQIASGGVLDLNGYNQQVVSLANSGGTGGTVTNSAPGTVATLTLQTATGTATVFSGNLQNGVGGGGVALTISGSGTQTLSGASTFSGGTTVNAGKLIVGNVAALGTGGLTLNGGNAQIQSGVTSSSSALVLASAAFNGGTLDITNNRVLIRSVSDMTAAVSAAVMAGQLTTSVTSTPSTPGATTTVGYLNGASYIAFNGASFGGQTVNATDEVVRWTYAGDINLDGDVDLRDFQLMDAGYLSGFDDSPGHVATWLNGDVNHDGKVDYQDFAEAVAAVGGTALGQQMYATYSAEFGSAFVEAFNAAVPEPASLLLLGLGAAGLLLRRRK